MDSSFEKRKQSHFSLSLNKNSQSSKSSDFDQIQLLHEALPEINLDQVSIEQSWQGQALKTPFFACSMTAGWSDSLSFNLKLAKACEKHSWIMGIGSQRGQLFDDSKTEECKKIRQACPQAIILANIGITQAIDLPLKNLMLLITSLQAQALTLHLNPLQEALQKEGTPQFKSGLQTIKKLVKNLPCPIIIKETGCGFSKNTLDMLTDIGVAAIDVSGRGGTHWGRIEGERYQKTDFQFGIGELFSSWGISTVDSLMHSQSKPRDYELWASGGCKSGLDAAKAIAIGAQRVGFANILLKALQLGEETLDKLMSRLAYELKISLFCTGSASLKELQSSKKWKHN